MHKKVFRHLAEYNTAIADYLERISIEEARNAYPTIHNPANVEGA